jgi:hypothetical protein
MPTILATWLAPDRDPLTIRAEPEQVLCPELWALLQMDGLDGHEEALVEERTGVEIKRARRWHKLYERLGLMHRENGLTTVSSLGATVLRSTEALYDDLVATGLALVSRFQLKNPIDETEEARYPDDCDLHPLWAILKAASDLDGKIHWDEVNREIMRVLRHADLGTAIERIRLARLQKGYSPDEGGTSAAPLLERVYPAQDSAPSGKTPDGQLRDQILTPLLSRAGFGKLLLLNPGQDGAGYWTIPMSVRARVAATVATVPSFRSFDSPKSWMEYLGGAIGSLDAPGARVVGATNRIFFGPPGTGKTTRVASETRGWRVVRCTFHPEYGYADFIGSIRPVTGIDPSVSGIIGPNGETRPRPIVFYDFVAGPFSEALRDALRSPTTRVALVIEEINRGDCAGIFGDVFQLLDRNRDGSSEFPLRLPDMVRVYLHNSGIKDESLANFYLPSNLWLFATMNTSDQSLYPMDAAFKRRWSWESVSIEDNVDDLDLVMVWQPEGAEQRLRWLSLIHTLNEAILSANLAEDRRIGPRFLSPRSGSIGAHELRNKLLFYLWHDVFRSRRNALFDSKVKSFDDAQSRFDRHGFFGIFTPDITRQLRSRAESVDASEQPAPPTDSGPLEATP